MGKPIAEAEWDIVRHPCSTPCNLSPPGEPLAAGPHSWDIASLCAQDDVAGCYEYYADLAEKLDSRQDEPIEVPMEEFKTCLRREPLGVVGLISAWN